MIINIKELICMKLDVESYHCMTTCDLNMLGEVNDIIINDRSDNFMLNELVQYYEDRLYAD